MEGLGINQANLVNKPLMAENQLANVNPAVANKVRENTEAAQPEKKLRGVKECETCKNRRYQDGSNDPGVSFKAPTKLSPGEAVSAVVSHEREHYSRENAKAAEEDREVLSNNIQIFTSVCPECGKMYVSGGLTTTVTKKRAENERKTFPVGNNMDVSV